MSRILCGWCGLATAAGQPCHHCGRDPRVAWEHRGATPPELPDPTAGRRPLDEAAIREQYEGARAAITAAGHDPTVEAIAERLDRSPRTVRAWKQKFAL